MSRGLHPVAVAALLMVALLSCLPGVAAAAMSEQQVREAVAEAYGVRVLKLESGTLDGRDVFLVTVMNPGGNFNEAFRVSRLAVDAETGRLVPGPAGDGDGTAMSAPEPTDTLRPSGTGTR